MTSLITLGSLVLIFTLGATNNDFKFPEDRDDDGSLNANGPVKPTERLPIAAPDQCPQNMLLYPGDGPTSVWICDCNVGYVYFPLNNSCHEPYRQGPCPPGNYVVLPVGEVVPKCTRNPCLTDGLVPYNDTCSKINSIPGPCPNNQILTVNGTFQLQCSSVDIVKQHIIDAPANRCPNGSRRNALGQCRPQI